MARRDDREYCRGDFDRTTSTGKLPLPLRDAVQTVEIIPRETIEERGVTTINEAIETAVGVQPIVGYGGMDAAGVTSRGFTNEWVLRNGFRLFRHGVPVETVNLDRLEVLKGPASLLAGQTDPGGMLNLVSKAPVREPFFDFSTTVGSHAFYRNTIDLGGAVPGTGDRLLTRFTMAQESAASHRDTIDQDKLFLAPQVRWQITPRTWVGALSREAAVGSNGNTAYSLRLDAGAGRQANIKRAALWFGNSAATTSGRAEFSGQANTMRAVVPTPSGPTRVTTVTLRSKTGQVPSTSPNFLRHSIPIWPAARPPDRLGAPDLLVPNCQRLPSRSSSWSADSLRQSR